jgi:hypothetical protein
VFLSFFFSLYTQCGAVIFMPDHANATLDFSAAFLAFLPILLTVELKKSPVELKFLIVG